MPVALAATDLEPCAGEPSQRIQQRWVGDVLKFCDDATGDAEAGDFGRRDAGHEFTGGSLDIRLSQPRCLEPTSGAEGATQCAANVAV